MRDGVLGGAGDGPGLAVLRTQGMWAWMRALAAEPQAAPIPAAMPASPLQVPARTAARPAEHRELVRILAGLLLGGELATHHEQGAQP